MWMWEMTHDMSFLPTNHEDQDMAAAGSEYGTGPPGCHPYQGTRADGGGANGLWSDWCRLFGTGQNPESERPFRHK